MSNDRLTLKEIQEAEYNILKCFDEFCNKNNLQYYLAGGTLLGAIREGKFIEWDDDIDLCMPRTDYLKLIKLAKNGISHNYLLDTPYLDSDSPATIVRIYDKRTYVHFTQYKVPLKIGVWIDIFPLDGVPENCLKRKAMFLAYRIINIFYLSRITKFGIKRKNIFSTVFQFLLLIIYPVIRLIGHKRFIKILEKISLTYDYEKSEFVGVLDGRAGEKETMRKENIFPLIKVKFGDDFFNAPANYDEYLTNLYGDYMTPPPKKEQKSRHIIEVYWKNND